MKPIKMNFIAYLTSIIVLLSFSSCAVKSHFLNSEIAPAAQGTVQVKIDKNKNYLIKIELSNLSPSTRLTPPKEAYVVWMVNVDNAINNLGQLNSTTNFMSKNLDASFETVSASKPYKIMITAENDVSTQYPSLSEVILTTGILNVKDR
ncbi:MAG TPA: hypothetical protein P5084_09840 [Paludibacter sp.]|nr:hypothetical protein [Paludibacter sp.]